MKRVWFITGCSRGIGYSLTRAVLKMGDQVVATARNMEDLADLAEAYPHDMLPLQLDVREHEKINGIAARAIKHFGRIDILVNNAGFGIVGAVEGYSNQQIYDQVDVNLLAPVLITKAFLPYMRKQRSGRIIQISSIGGRVGNAGLSIYMAAKFGLGGFSEALAKEVAHLGIMVTSVEPGVIRTDWSGSSMTYAGTIPGYENNVGQLEQYFKSGTAIGTGDPDRTAEAIIMLAEIDAPPVHLVFGSDAVAILKLHHAAQSSEFEQWIPFSIMTDHEDSQNFLETELGRAMLKAAERQR